MWTRPGRLTANFLMVAVLAFAAPAVAAQSADDLAALNKQVVQLSAKANTTRRPPSRRSPLRFPNACWGGSIPTRFQARTSWLFSIRTRAV